MNFLPINSDPVFDFFYLFRLILAAVVILSKFYNDVYYSNNYIACQYGIQLRILNEIERQFCKII